MLLLLDMAAKSIVSGLVFFFSPYFIFLVNHHLGFLKTTFNRVIVLQCCVGFCHYNAASVSATQ